MCPLFSWRLKTSMCLWAALVPELSLTKRLDSWTGTLGPGSLQAQLGSFSAVGGGEHEYDQEAHKDRIFGKHLQEHMEMLQEEDPTKYEAHLARFIADGTEPDGIEEMYSSAHSRIREDPVHKPPEKKGTTYKRVGNQVHASDDTSHTRSKRITLKTRRAKVAAKD